jgi:2-desacetyl-2-hydroxyethyl bacteriochlorophyllide A dehydrogenase
VRGLYLPGGRRVELRDVADPTPGPGQVVIQVRASTICGSDLRAIYREHLGTGAEAYQDVIAGHEPCGEVVAVGPDCRVRQVGDRVVVYHISGCGVCADCRRGYQISCTSDLRRAYGWQRDGGHADYLLAEERDLISLPDALSYVDGACVACGFGTAYEAVRRSDVSGADTVLVTGLGPVGQAIGLLAHTLGAPLVVGTDPNSARREAALGIGAVDIAADATDDAVRAALPSGADAAFDASGVGTAQQQALRHTTRWGRCVLVGEGGTMDLEVSRDLIHRQVTLIGSWVTSTVRMAELVDRLVRWELHPEIVVTHRCALTDGADAYRTADDVVGGKVAILPA